MNFEEAKLHLRRALDSGRLAHAYLVVGSPDGAAGKLTEFFQKELLQVPENDVLRIFPMKKSRVISIEQTRELLARLGVTAFSGGWKIAIVAHADRMNESAANAFLKMLEEPPAQTLIIMISDSPQALLPTIVSRCQRIALSEPPRELPELWFDQIMEVLANGDAKTRSPTVAAARAAAIVAILDDIKSASEKQVREEHKNDDAAGIEFDDDTLDALANARFRETRSLLLLTMQRWYRDVLALRARGGDEVVHYKAHIEELHERASRLTLKEAMMNVEAIEEISRQLERTMPEQAVFSYWLDRIAD